MTFIYLSSAVCKFKAHKRCAVRSTNNCKWTTLASIGNDIIEDEEGVSEQAVLYHRRVRVDAASVFEPHVSVAHCA